MCGKPPESVATGRTGTAHQVARYFFATGAKSIANGVIDAGVISIAAVVALVGLPCSSHSQTITTTGLDTVPISVVS